MVKHSRRDPNRERRDGSNSSYCELNPKVRQKRKNPNSARNNHRNQPGPGSKRCKPQPLGASIIAQRSKDAGQNCCAKNEKFRKASGRRRKGRQGSLGAEELVWARTAGCTSRRTRWQPKVRRSRSASRTSRGRTTGCSW